MPTIEERIKEIEKVDDANLLMGYRFLVSRGQKRSSAKAATKRAITKRASASSKQLGGKVIRKAG
jgi:hypothetical protein